MVCCRVIFGCQLNRLARFELALGLVHFTRDRNKRRRRRLQNVSTPPSNERSLHGRTAGCLPHKSRYSRSHKSLQFAKVNRPVAIRIGSTLQSLRDEITKYGTL